MKHNIFEDNLTTEEVNCWCEKMFGEVLTNHQCIVYVDREADCKNTTFYFVDSREKILLEITQPILKKFVSRFYGHQLCKKQEQWFLDYSKSGYNYFSSLENLDKFEKEVDKIYNKYYKKADEKFLNEKIHKVALKIENREKEKDER